ncbi:hypothetical protein CN975_28830 [Bacillus cereus]|nr:hypothetical protein CN477_00020 [Bacillus cereus]TFW50641.1 sortase [Bacillus sp. 007/AIA-02/001]PFB99408.1 hypothetical protein CN280_25440 [Bacillus cereus]PFF14243.1 hypothetical protein CN343_12410 [Bacillus cereus]PFK23198.1 hypothetical protein COJ03_11415 [Bacillus cereus]
MHSLNTILAYKVDQIKEVLPNETADLLIVKGQDYATLITCTPYGVNTHRLLVRGHRIPYVEQEKAMIQKASLKEGWIISIPIIILISIIMYLYFKRKKRNKKYELIYRFDRH